MVNKGLKQKYDKKRNRRRFFVPPEVKERMRGKDVEEGVKISRELISRISKFKEVAGIHIFPLRDMNLVCRLLN